VSIAQQASFGADDRTFIVPCADGKVYWYNEDTYLIREFLQGSPVHSAIFSPTEQNILTASFNGSAQLFDLQGNLQQTFPHGGQLRSAQFSPDGRYVLTASQDGEVRLHVVSENDLLIIAQSRTGRELNQAEFDRFCT